MLQRLVWVGNWLTFYLYKDEPNGLLTSQARVEVDAKHCTHIMYRDSYHAYATCLHGQPGCLTRENSVFCTIAAPGTLLCQVTTAAVKASELLNFLYRPVLEQDPMGSRGLHGLCLVKPRNRAAPYHGIPHDFRWDPVESRGMSRDAS